MHRTVFVLALILCGICQAEEKEDSSSYLVLSASVEPEGKDKPKWIRLWDGNRITWIEPDAIIVAIKPGRYVFDSIRIEKYKGSRRGTHVFKERPWLEIAQGKIYLIGHMVVKAPLTGKGRGRVVSGDNIALLKKACNLSPEIFDQFPVNTFGKMEEMKIDCNLIRDDT